MGPGTLLARGLASVGVKKCKKCGKRERAINRWWWALVEWWKR
jgi:hypothetical protein